MAGHRNETCRDQALNDLQAIPETQTALTIQALPTAPRAQALEAIKTSLNCALGDLTPSARVEAVTMVSTHDGLEERVFLADPGSGQHIAFTSNLVREPAGEAREYYRAQREEARRARSELAPLLTESLTPPVHWNDKNDDGSFMVHKSAVDGVKADIHKALKLPSDASIALQVIPTEDKFGFEMTVRRVDGSESPQGGPVVAFIQWKKRGLEVSIPSSQYDGLLPPRRY